MKSVSNETRSGQSIDTVMAFATGAIKTKKILGATAHAPRWKKKTRREKKGGYKNALRSSATEGQLASS